MRLPQVPPGRHRRDGHPAHQERAPLRPKWLKNTAAVLISGRSHPAHQERAPLRHRGGQAMAADVVESSRSPGAGSIAAEAGQAGSNAGRTVIPLTRSGLHCGFRGRRRRLNVGGGHPAHQERAPLRQPGHPRPPPTAGRHPAHQERAPLRPERLGQVRGSCLGHPAHQERAPLRPLHPERDAEDGDESSRSPGAGSIAASTERPAAARCRAVIPLTRSGLHCGPNHTGKSVNDIGSSRSPGAGSIAARPARRSGRGP